MTAAGRTDEAHALEQDARDPLRDFRGRFHLPDAGIYLLGNSLGLMARESEAAVRRVMDEWREMAIDGWLHGDPPWFHLAETLGAQAAGLVGASADEVVATGTTTTNIHALIGTFFRPTGSRRKILADELDFPSDIYALQGQIALKGLDPRHDLVLVPSPDGRTIEEEAIERLMTDEIALVFLPSVLYRSGQLLDIARLTRAAHKRGIVIGFDCSHSAGVVPHRFSEWDVDFAVWCGYKYLNAGPGSAAFLYVNRRHFGLRPLVPGWFGNRKETQFDMSLEFSPAPNAGAWQISSPSILSAAPLEASLRIFREAGIDRIREKSLAQTKYLMDLAEAELLAPPYDFRFGTPREPERRGGHVALERDAGAWETAQALKKRGIIGDFRPPNIIRLAPVALYTTYHEIWRTVRHLREIIDSGEYLSMSESKSAIT
jgi:kynureninase